jgi:hypothetical protein
VAARKLARGDLLEAEDGHTSAIVSVTERKGKFAVYNLEVEGSHTYFAGGWWVHNDCLDIAKALQREFGGDIYKIENYWKHSGERAHLGEHDWWEHYVHVKDGMVTDPMHLGDYVPRALEDYKKTWESWESAYNVYKFEKAY